MSRKKKMDSKRTLLAVFLCVKLGYTLNVQLFLSCDLQPAPQPLSSHRWSWMLFFYARPRWHWEHRNARRQCNRCTPLFCRQRRCFACQLDAHGHSNSNAIRKPSRFFRAFSGLRSCFQPLPTLPPVDTKKGQGVREHPPPGGTVPRILNPRSFAPVESSSS